jgi:hypothetical protein
MKDCKPLDHCIQQGEKERPSRQNGMGKYRWLKIA